MEIFETKKLLSARINELKDNSLQVGLVPTMGALHHGHLSLIHRAFEENDYVVVSVFVNPTQFDNAEDLKKYPRTLGRDLELLKVFEDKIIVYTPTAEDIYDENIQSENHEFDGLESEMEGANRPGHFDGVGTIVGKLFEIVNPNRAYFGEKDFQQLQIIRKMVEKKGFSVIIVGCPIFREENGLAMSSRNERLSEKAKNEAAFIYQTLLQAQENFEQKSIDEIKTFVEKQFENHPSLTLEYFEIADEDTLQSAKTKQSGKKYRGFIVAHIENVRLIDNLAFV